MGEGKPKLPPEYRYTKDGNFIYLVLIQGNDRVVLHHKRFRKYETAAISAWQQAYERLKKDLMRWQNND